MIKLKYSIYGNCQAHALATCLNRVANFTEKYEYIPLELVHNIKSDDLKFIQNQISELDLIIYQHVSDNYRIPELSTSKIINFLPHDAVKISIPSLYFNGYFPHLDVIPELKSATNFVHDCNILAGYIKKISENDLYEIIASPDFYSKEEVENFLMISISDLKKREILNKVDIKVSPFIQKFHQDKKLFNQFNHPTGFVFSFLVVSILENLGVSYKKHEVEFIKKCDFIGGVQYTIYPSTAYHLDLRFPNNFAKDKVEGIRGKKYSYRELVHAFYDFYDSVNNKLTLKKFLKKNKPFTLEKMDEMKGCRTSISNRPG